MDYFLQVSYINIMRWMYLILILLLSFSMFSQVELSFEPKENFDFELDYSFKTRPPVSADKVTFIEGAKRGGAQVLPYLKINFNFNSLPSEYYRIRVEDGDGKLIKSKKLKRPDIFVLDMGFSDDVKDRITPHKYVIIFQTKAKNSISKIEVEVEENGDLLLNGSFHGRI